MIHENAATAPTASLLGNTGGAYLLATQWTSFNSTPVTDQGSGATASVAFWQPNSLAPNQYYLGMCGQSIHNYNNLTPSAVSTYVYALKNDDPTNSMLARPTGFQQLWTCVDNDRSSNLGIYTLIAPPGYVGIGCIAVPDFNTPPAVNNYPQLMCVRGDLVDFCYTSNQSQWSDQGSGAPLDVTVWASPNTNISIPAIWTNYPPQMQVADLIQVYTG